MNYNISHPTKVINCEIDLPSSKSISNRLLIIKALCKEEFEIKNLSDSDDTIALQKVLVNDTKTIDVGASGTTFRFLTAYFSTQVGKDFILTGTDRMKERPIKELVDALQSLGAEIEYVEKEGFPPLRIKGIDLKGGEITIDGTISSQFISALLLIAPTLKNGLNFKIEGKIVSKPYIKMTLKLMQEFGVDSSWNGNRIEVNPQNFIAKNFEVESDWSVATFWFEIAALSKSCNIKLNGLSEKSIQGDKKATAIFKKLGVSSVFENNTLILTKNKNINFPKHINLLAIPDLYQPLKCTLFAVNNNPEIRGIQTLKDKETNRIDAVEKELIKLTSSKIIETYKDHRMAMSFAPLSLKFGEIQINNAEVVSKSYPNFWKDLEKGGFKIFPLTDSNN
jgi:3-phosphoshikimate 1-carboxyvinyltransferase